MASNAWHGSETGLCPTSIVYRMGRRNKVTGKMDGEPNRSEQETRELLQEARGKWESGKEWERLKEKIQERKNFPKVNKIVAFACCTMAAGGTLKHSMTFATQHAMILSLRHLFSERSNGEISCFAQDPAYTPIDVTVLGSSGITVLPNPKGFLEVDDSTIVISMAPNVPVRQIIADIARPAVLIWNAVEVPYRDGERVSYVDGKMVGDGLADANRTDPSSERVAGMVGREYERLDWGVDDKGAWKGAGVYVRKEGE